MKLVLDDPTHHHPDGARILGNFAKLVKGL
jgi:hypothetical protein